MAISIAKKTYPHGGFAVVHKNLLCLRCKVFFSTLHRSLADLSIVSEWVVNYIIRFLGDPSSVTSRCGCWD